MSACSTGIFISAAEFLGVRKVAKEGGLQVLFLELFGVFPTHFDQVLGFFHPSLREEEQVSLWASNGLGMWSESLKLSCGCAGC